MEHRLPLLLPTPVPRLALPCAALQEVLGSKWEQLESELSPTGPDGQPADVDLLSELCGHLTPIMLGRRAKGVCVALPCWAQ